MSLQLQSFVVAAVVAAFFLADRIGGSESLSRRLYQVSLGFALVFAVTSATAAFFRAEQSGLFSSLVTGGAGNAPLGALGSSDPANKARDAASVQAGLAVVFLVGGFLAMRRFHTLPLGFALGGLLLLLVGGGQGPADVSSSLSSLTSLFGSVLGQASKGRDITYFVVLLVGTLLLVAYGYWWFERSPTPSADRQPVSM